MAKNKTQKFKDYLASTRRSVGPGYTNAPMWAMRKAQERLWNPKQKRHWKQTNLGADYRSSLKKGLKKRRHKNRTANRRKAHD